MKRKKAIFIFVPVITVMLAVSFFILKDTGIIHGEPIDLGPGHNPASWPKAHCTGPINAVNVVLWSENDQLSQNQDQSNSRIRLLEKSNEILDSFWDGPVSIIITSDVNLALPQSKQQLSLFVEEREDDTIGTFAILFGKDPKSLSIGDVQPGAPKIGVERLFLNDETVSVTSEFLRFYVQSLQDITAGKCARPVSDSISGPESGWKFFPPYDERYENWKKRQNSWF